MTDPRTGAGQAGRSWFRRHYGAGPFHLLGLLACFAFSGYVASLIAQVPQATRIGVWLLGAVVAHDLILWPVYAVADRLAVVSAKRIRARPRVPWINHVRVPVVISACLLAVSFPLVLNWSGRTYRAATGLSPSPYTTRWLLITAALGLASVILYAIRYAWALTHGRPVQST